MIKSLKKKQSGFTLIELMVVIVIIGILVAIALPNFIGAQDRAKLSSVKANMHTIQTMVETYAVDWGGVYDADIVVIAAEASDSDKNPYWKNITNPFTSAATTVANAAGGGTLDAASGLGTVIMNNIPAATTDAGVVAYNSTTADATRYFIYGGDKKGNPIQDKGKNFVLTNS